MLNKQGLFTRNGSSANRIPPQPVNPLNTPNKPASSALAPSMQDSVDSAASETDSKNETVTKAEGTSGSRLIVGPDVKLKGAEIQDCDVLVVEGRVEATMDSRVIQIADKGAFSGKVGIDVAEIHGHFDGELTARSQLIIHSTGRVNGKIRYGKILIEEGGELSGDIAAISENDSRVSRLARNDLAKN
jgi:cytoskeletal protein CcmA (bactofilin family)